MAYGDLRLFRLGERVARSRISAASAASFRSFSREA